MKSKSKKLAAIKLDIHKDLILRSIRGERGAQFELYKLYSKAMFNICYRMLNNHEEAEDALQEAFSDAFRRLGSFRFESTFGAWLKRIVVNQCINTIKRRKENLELFEEIEVFDHEEDEERDEAEIKYTVEKIHRAMNMLPDGGKMVFSLYLLEGYDHSEIAEIMQITESTSKSQFLRAKRRIKELIENF